MGLIKLGFTPEVCGTPGYLAPELLRAAMYDDASGYDYAVDL